MIMATASALALAPEATPAPAAPALIIAVAQSAVFAGDCRALLVVDPVRQCLRSTHALRYRRSNDNND